MYKFLCEHMFSVLLGIYLEVELLSLMVTPCLTFEEPPEFQSNCTILHSHCGGWELLFLHILTKCWLWTICYSSFLLCHPRGYGMVSCGHFHLHFPNDYVKLSILSCAYWSFTYLLWRNVCSGPLPIFKLGYLSFLLLSCKSPWWFGGTIPYMICSYLLAFHEPSFHFLDGTICSTISP